ncbi:dTDP-glucose 4,6-dehydratase [Prochlorococcus sp. AH-736-K21]|nr:dTDP-glucose 4,6-dehydratase [Prochlorococcus sp. AH-736-K21]MDA9707729.1 dTDP-glucose 4,6-dehydratase [Prochlorococcus sp. AH-736-K21]
MNYKFPIKDCRVLITGGAGFIGGYLLEKLFINTNHKIYNIDKYGYASDLTRIEKLIKENPLKSKNLINIKADLINEKLISNHVNSIKPHYIFHFAAESHVDRSIKYPEPFFINNVLSTLNLVSSSYNYWNNLEKEERKKFRFIHISTDEVFGSLEEHGKFKESSQINPRSPYSASKAASDHIINAWYHTYNFPAIVTNCSNNYGPWQFPEKLIPTIISKCIKNEQIPIYGNGSNIRDWLFVDDHINALIEVARNGRIGEKYCIGGDSEKTNLEVVSKICLIIDKKLNRRKQSSALISFVKDRLGHDKRYSIDNSKIKNELNWERLTNFDSGLEKTVDWYIDNLSWLESIQKRKSINY